MLINAIIIGLVVLFVFIAGKKALKDLKQSKCAGCSGACQVKPVQLGLKKNFVKPK